MKKKAQNWNIILCKFLELGKFMLLLWHLVSTVRWSYKVLHAQWVVFEGTGVRTSAGH